MISLVYWSISRQEKFILTLTDLYTSPTVQQPTKCNAKRLMLTNDFTNFEFTNGIFVVEQFKLQRNGLNLKISYN